MEGNPKNGTTHPKSGTGRAKTSRPSFFLGSVAPREGEGREPLPGTPSPQLRHERTKRSRRRSGGRWCLSRCPASAGVTEGRDEREAGAGAQARGAKGRMPAASSTRPTEGRDARTPFLLKNTGRIYRGLLFSWLYEAPTRSNIEKSSQEKRKGSAARHLLCP